MTRTNCRHFFTRHYYGTHSGWIRSSACRSPGILRTVAGAFLHRTGVPSPARALGVCGSSPCSEKSRDWSCWGWGLNPQHPRFRTSPKERNRVWCLRTKQRTKKMKGSWREIGGREGRRGVSEALAVQLWEDTKLIADGVCHLYAGFSVGASLRVLTFQSCG